MAPSHWNPLLRYEGCRTSIYRTSIVAMWELQGTDDFDSFKYYLIQSETLADAMRPGDLGRCCSIAAKPIEAPTNEGILAYIRLI